MAQFKVGQRVKAIRGWLAGCEGTVVLPLGEHPGRQLPGLHVGVEMDGHPCPTGPGTHYFYFPESLVPLTPPAEDTWAADKVKELVKPKPMDRERLPQPVPEGDKQPALREVLEFYRERTENPKFGT